MNDPSKEAMRRMEVEIVNGPSLERRAEELANEALAQHWDSGNYPVGPGVPDSFRKNVGYAKDLAAIVLKLLSENRQVREQERLAKESRDKNLHLVFERNTTIERISAEREAYRWLLAESEWWSNTDNIDDYMAQAVRAIREEKVKEAEARRILAENDR